jgi:hypothetical protein
LHRVKFSFALSVATARCALRLGTAAKSGSKAAMIERQKAELAVLTEAKAKAMELLAELVKKTPPSK